MNVSDYMEHDAVGLSKLIKNKEVSAKELVEAAFSRLKKSIPQNSMR